MKLSTAAYLKKLAEILIAYDPKLDPNVKRLEGIIIPQIEKGALDSALDNLKQLDQSIRSKSPSYAPFSAIDFKGKKYSLYELYKNAIGLLEQKNAKETLECIKTILTAYKGAADVIRQQQRSTTPAPMV